MRERGPEIEQVPTGRLLHDLFEEAKHVLTDGTRLLRAEIETAKFEIRREAKKAGPAAALTGVGSVLLHAAVLLFAAAVALLLSLALPSWAAFGIIAVVLALAGALFLARGRDKLRSIELKPASTIHNLEEDQRWAKGLTQNVRSNLRRDT
jgi:hypothetical protein